MNSIFRSTPPKLQSLSQVHGEHCLPTTLRFDSAASIKTLSVEQGSRRQRADWIHRTKLSRSPHFSHFTVRRMTALLTGPTRDRLRSTSWDRQIRSTQITDRATISPSLASQFLM